MTPTAFTVVDTLRNSSGQVLHKYYQDLYHDIVHFLEQSENTNIKVEGKLKSVYEVYNYNLPDVIRHFAAANRVATPNSVKAIGALTAIIEHLSSRSLTVRRTPGTTHIHTNKELVIMQRDFAEQLVQFCKLKDRLKVGFEGGGSLMVTLTGVKSNNVHCAVKKRDADSSIEGRLLYVSNMQNDAPLVRLLEQIEKIPKSMITYFFPEGARDAVVIEERKGWDLELDQLDDYKKQAARNIMHHIMPYPFILHGIAGSGKSKLLVHLMHILLKYLPKCKLLISSTNNSAVDLLLLKLLDSHQNLKFVRFVSETHSQKLPLPLMKGNSSTTDANEALRKFQNANVLAATICKLRGLPTEHGIYPNLIVLDECSAIMEIEGIAALYPFIKEGHTQLVFAGDLKQLGPMCKSKISQTLRHDLGSAKRLIRNDSTYNAAIDTGQKVIGYNKLGINYRTSTPTALKLFETFYDGDERSMPDPEKMNKYADLKGFPEKYEIFIHTKGRVTGYSNNSGSVSNMCEVQAITQVLDILLNKNKVPASDILIQPLYYKQKKDLGYRMIDSSMVSTDVVGSRDGVLVIAPSVAQGCEAAISIISTVVSHAGKMGPFLRDPAQALVALSRASSLTIIIGDHDILRQDRVWSRFLTNSYTLDKAGKFHKF